MDTIRKQLVTSALRRYGNIQPCGVNTRLQDCFTCHEDSVLFWFNTSDGSTRVVSQRVWRERETTGGLEPSLC